MKYKRLNKIIEFVDSSMNCADIGADHGYVTINIAQKFSANNFVAVENKNGPFNVLKKNVLRKSLTNVTCFLDDGLNPIDNNINTVILAGMGGSNIINIIKNNIKKISYIEYFIIDAHKDEIKLLKFMNDIGYNVVKSEQIEENGINYTIFLFKKSKCKVLNKFSCFFEFYINDKSLSPYQFVLSTKKMDLNSLKKNEKFISIVRF